jgi:hypothetical protein
VLYQGDPVALLSHVLVGFPGPLDGEPWVGSTWRYQLDLERTYFPAILTTCFSAEREWLLESLAFFIATRHA